jgi:pimeloyl-ACP methyl ester carboxylesterase
LTGDRDALVDVEDVRQLFGELIEPKRLAVVRGAGHMHWGDGAEQLHESLRAMYLSGRYPDTDFDALELAEAMRPFAELCPEEHAHQVLRALATAHLDAHLKNDSAASAFLESDLVGLFADRGIELEYPKPAHGARAARASAFAGGASRGEWMVQANGVELATEAFGDPSHPTLLLPQGACSTMLRYDEAVCRRLAAAGLQVIRYDNRDSGRSTSYPTHHPPYTLQDMAKDAITVLDAYGVQRAHLMGGSQGGMIAQIAAIQDPDRVASLILIMSTPDSDTVLGHLGAANSASLPSPDQKVIDMIGYLFTVDWSDREQAIAAYHVEQRTLGGSRYPVSDAAIRAYAIAEIERTRNLASMRFNHGVAQHQSARWRPFLGQIQAPTLVIHGSEDPILPLAHGQALANEIPGARLIVVEGMGHDPAPGTWDVVVPAVLEHIFSGVRV